MYKGLFPRNELHNLTDGNLGKWNGLHWDGWNFDMGLGDDDMFFFRTKYDTWFYFYYFEFLHLLAETKRCDIIIVKLYYREYLWVTISNLSFINYWMNVDHQFPKNLADFLWFDPILRFPIIKNKHERNTSRNLKFWKVLLETGSIISNKKTFKYCSRKKKYFL